MKIKGMILVETLTSFFVLLIGLTFLRVGIQEANKLIVQRNELVDCYLAREILHVSGQSTIVLHDKKYDLKVIAASIGNVNYEK